MPTTDDSQRAESKIIQEVRKISPKRGKDYLIVNVDEKFSGEAAPGKTFIYVFLKTQDPTNRNHYQPFYVGKTKNTKTRFANHKIKNEYLKNHKANTISIYLAGSVINDFSLLAEKDLISRFIDNSMLSDNSTYPNKAPKKRITKHFSQILEEWNYFWNKKMLEETTKKVITEDSITKNDIATFFENTKYPSALANIISNRLVRTYDPATKTSHIILTSADIKNDIKAVNKAIKSLRYWVVSSPIVLNQKIVFQLSTQTKKLLIQIKEGRKVLNNNVPQNLQEMKSPDVVKVKPYRKKQPVKENTKLETSEGINKPNKSNFRKKINNFFLNNPNVSNSEYQLAAKIVKQINPETKTSILPLTPSEVKILEEGILKAYFIKESVSELSRMVLTLSPEIETK